MSTLALSRTKQIHVPDFFGRALATNDSLAPAVARVVLGAVMLPHAVQKAFGWLGGPGFEPSVDMMSSKLGIPMPLAILAVVGELVGSLLLITGAFARLGAVLIATIMAVATLLVHAPNGFFMNWFGQQHGEGFEYHLLAIGMAVVTIIAGAGKCSVDRWMTANGDNAMKHGI